ncbi:hypothetical protein NKH85_04770 [Mesorhizobium sp. M0924]|uniref:hypothetical protein n=1 Tax=unclassified Mesorhizobium TaxID=325217 RepID=UPI0003CE75D1|nr:MULTISPECIES: hypothetical protein [unclassified Mesorhizobium]ESW79104.1 hypothetical protein X773_18685 [Mesorhizobium sp. LSJC285A00]ESW88542.1 hypothetical protein X770_17935 [Mesorhizobium sp. LSJC269B00]ESX86457.1 hypothetical protein X756_18380 [Mesorhizobium sp. LSHC412B00]ESY09729.1 hypothetical protein X752_14090 [Mesorhizobium sp. LNJC398B00]ESY35421.1 hypothetical protein X748_14630 [Mesorhizobium sp. LNJC386A00]
MPPPSRISIVETGNELLITNPPRTSDFRTVFVLIGAAIVAYTGYMGLTDMSSATLTSGTLGLLSFVAVIALFTYFLGKDFIWRVFGRETLRLTDTAAVRSVRGSLRNRWSLPLKGHLRVEILDHTYPTDEVGLSEVISLTNANGVLVFGRELSRLEAEAVASAVEHFTGRHNLSWR